VCARARVGSGYSLKKWDTDYHKLAEKKYSSERNKIPSLETD